MSKQWSQKGQQGESGLYEEFIVTIASSRIKIPEGWDGPVWVINGEFELPDGNRIDSDIRMSVGDFEAGDAEGTYALHSSQDREKHLSSQSKGMKFIKSAFGFPELAQALMERSREIDGSDLEERDFAAWDGLRVRVAHDSYESTNPKTGAKGTGKQPKVVEFLGTADAPVAGGSGAAAPAATVGTNGTGTVTEAQAAILAKQSDNYLAYAEAVVAQGAAPNDAVASQDFYSANKA